MSFNELMLTTEKETNAFEKVFEQCIMFAEASYQEYKTNLKEAELKVIQESGTPDDLIYLENAAKEGFLVRAGKAVTKMIDYFLTWLKNIIESIQEFLNNKKNKEDLSKAEKIIKTNPKIKSTKIEIDDVERMEKVCKKHEALVDRKIALFKAGKFTENDIKELENIEKEYEKEKDAAKKVTTTVVIVTAIPLLGLTLKNLQKQEKEAKDISTPTVKETDTPDNMEAYTNAISLKLRIKKDLASFYNSTFGKIFKTVKGVVTKSGEIEPEIEKSKKEDKEETKTESTIDETSYLDELINEIEECATEVSTEASTPEEFDAEAYLEALEATLPEPENNVTESTMSPKEVEDYLEALEKEICEDYTEPVYEESTTEEGEDEMVTAEQYLEAMEAELFEEDETEVTESENITAEEYLAAMESELFAEESDNEENVEMTAEQYLEAMEAELFEED